MEEFFFTEIFSGCYLYYSPACKSTGTLAKLCAKKYYNGSPIVVYTFNQTQGRGQGNNLWESEAGKNIAATFIFDNTHIQSNNPVFFNKAIALGVRAALQHFLAFPVTIKWPNDIYCQNKKLCGLLLESFALENANRGFSAGIGINVNQQRWEGDYPASSIYTLSGLQAELIEVLHKLIHHITFYINILNKNEISLINSEFNQYLYKLNEQVTLVTQDNSEISGTLQSVDDVGRIILHTENGVLAFHHGQVKLKK